MFRPCIDLHDGKVKQIVGGTLQDGGAAPTTNFISDRPASWFAELYRNDQLKGGHVILLGSGNEEAALSALTAYPGGLQVGGGVNLENAPAWLSAGASHVILTSWVFREGRVMFDRLEQLARAVGREKIVLDLSCRKRGSDYIVVTDRWQNFTELTLSRKTLQDLSSYCAEFLVHAVDVEGLCQGIDQQLVADLADWSSLPMTYAGGARSLEDLETTTRISRGRVDLTIGSALDIFGGTGVKYADAVAFNRRQRKESEIKLC